MPVEGISLPGSEFAAGYADAVRAITTALTERMVVDFEPSEMTIGEASAFRTGFLAGWQKAKRQALDLLDPAHEGIIGECCEVSLGAIKDMVQGMEPGA